MSTDRRTFLKGLFATVAATPLVKSVARIADKAITPVKHWFYNDLRNWGAWDARYEYYDEAKAASDKLSNEIIKNMMR